ncbi:amidinotransferase [Pseudomonas sp. Leaf129]|uniref:arginine deiminase family protein n=1 Tax=Pseudomonas sp. Leaf129 TaxID=1736268 RepID=UPI0007026F63|nr:arginine deiminase family protein [Pseudomonas sp. Leaf129]KQQ63499.1 amidinotransferase [Pseudomonas sp. Leaf129]
MNGSSEIRVSSHNEWDPLEEVIVGVMQGAAVPEWDIMLEATMPEDSKDFFIREVGNRLPQSQYEAACKELDQLAEVIASRGIIVTRPDKLEQAKSFSTPSWSAPSGLYAAMPRDILLILGDTIIESPMSWRSRYFEIDAYRPLLKEYFRSGAKWISAPKPQLLDELYQSDYDKVDPLRSDKFVINNFEPVFDAADFIKCGYDIFAQLSHVTNSMGIEWVRRHIDKKYNIHLLESTDCAPMHIDATFMPLAPGKILLNPERMPILPRVLKGWDVRYAPKSTIPSSHTMYMSSTWTNMNVLMLDPKTVVVEEQETSLIDMLAEWGFEVVTVPFRNVMRFGGAFHCVTCDVRRRGELLSYIN